MTRPKRVLCIMDLSLAGRAGLAVALPVLAACGVQGCPLPTALFSTHTGGFGAVVRRQQADFCREALAHFAREQIGFDAVYTGYLGSAEQSALARQALVQYPDALHLVDPAMGDSGQLYSGLADDTVARMGELCRMAGLITPNYTESALLTGEDAAAAASDETLERRLRTLAKSGCSVLITSVPTGSGFDTAGLDTKSGQIFRFPQRHIPQHYPGTGDTLAAALCGLLLQNPPEKLETIAKTASHFVETAVSYTYQHQGKPRSGLWFEPCLPLLQAGSITAPAHTDPQ